MAAFDFDGTMIRGDSLLPFLGLVAGRARLGRALAAMGPRIACALAGMGDRDAAKEAFVGRVLGGQPEADVVEAGHRYADALVPRLRPDVLALVDWHRRQGHRLVIVSASLAVYLQPLAPRCGFDHALCTALEVGDDGRLTGRFDGPNVRGPEKAAQLAAWMTGETGPIWAYGDSAGDHHLLSAATHALRVRRRAIEPWTGARRA